VQLHPAEEENDEVARCMLALLVVQVNHEVQHAGNIYHRQIISEIFHILTNPPSWQLQAVRQR
jgi:hypothetical protein